MEVFRIDNRTYVDQQDGMGAAFGGGRWNSKDIPIIYTSSSCALAMLEKLVHLPRFSETTPDNLIIIPFFIPDPSLIQVILPTDLPTNWNSHADNHVPLATRKMGDDFIKANEYPVLRVPSAIMLIEYNYLLNPNHPAFKNNRIEQRSETTLKYDERLFPNIGGKLKQEWLKEAEKEWLKKHRKK